MLPCDGRLDEGHGRRDALEELDDGPLARVELAHGARGAAAQAVAAPERVLEPFDELALLQTVAEVDAALAQQPLQLRRREVGRGPRAVEGAAAPAEAQGRRRRAAAEAAPRRADERRVEEAEGPRVEHEHGPEQR